MAEHEDHSRVPELRWASLSHRQVLAALIEAGWVPSGVGDWATGLRSPDGTLVARICPFDPAYAAFVELCRVCAGNPWLPKIELAAELEGGGSAVFLEYAAPAGPEVAEELAERFRDGDGTGFDDEFQQVRDAAGKIDASYRAATPWWDGLDLNEAHVRRALDGRLILIDIFCMDGAALYGMILDDLAEVHRRMPRDRMRYVLEIPYIARESSPAEIAALRNAWSALD
ncbi:hypothetical protein [Catenulispora subtropica]|uniref:hypothetical protein n=1 Tax=Catenulispora subtropica TaxID=450798 RepID=UPI0031D6573C